MNHYAEENIHSSHIYSMHPFGAIRAASENGFRAVALPVEKFWCREGGALQVRLMELPSNI
jgi:hypothetical protein